MVKKPELLAPVGNVESFYAALEGGSDAIYLGLKQFNARNRAGNFTFKQIQAIVKEATEKGVKVYITLNTIIKNPELPDVINILCFLSKVGVHAIIIQDWGIHYIVKKYFPGLKMHASTQMGNHNSLGRDYSSQNNFERIIMARELTFPELKKIALNSPIQIEVFVHGAFCYSFSGMCLFSSYLGGSGANRGLCAQPCRREYSNSEKKQFIFNLKDNQQLGQLDNLIQTGVSSLKIEGRMKSAEYIFKVAGEYRKAIDSGQPESLPENFDFARKKTDYFLGGDISNSFSTETASGLLVGTVKKADSDWMCIDSELELKLGYRLRIQKPGADERFNIKVKEINTRDGLQCISYEKGNPALGDNVFITDFRNKKFPSKFEGLPSKRIPAIKYGFQKKILDELENNEQKTNKERVYIRINSVEWLRKIYLPEVDGLFLSFSKQEWKKLNTDAHFIQKNIDKLYIELPKFIPEKSVDFYKNLLLGLKNKGFYKFIISHLSQKLIIPPKSIILTNENVYIFNGAAIKSIKKQGVKNYIYPLENDFENLLNGTDRGGIQPVYFYPELFYSRMPVAISGENGIFENDEKIKFRRVRKNGLTVIIPEKPVSLLQYKNKLFAQGFRQYLLDVSYDKPSKNLIKTLVKRLSGSLQVQPSTTFNFTKGLK